MKILVLLKMVPDTVEELKIADNSLDLSDLRFIVNERDEHALEQALLLKERHGGTVTVLALEAPGVDDVLFTALAKGADRAIKVSALQSVSSTASLARLFAQTLTTLAGVWPADLILTGVQAIDDLDGLLAPSLAQALKLPYLGIISSVKITEQRAIVTREYAGGIRGEFEIPLPAVLGIQSAEQPPRYVPVAKVRAAMKSQKIESVSAPAVPTLSSVKVVRMAKPQVAGRAEFLEGSPEEVARKICELLSARGLLPQG